MKSRKVACELSSASEYISNKCVISHYHTLAKVNKPTTVLEKAVIT